LPAHRHIRLGAFLMANGHHAAAWRHPASRPEGTFDLDFYKGIAARAEAAKFDLLFVADSPAGWPARDPEILRHRGAHAGFEPVTLWSALAAVTERIGFVATASTTYEDPYLLARKFASLDWLSKGRAGWNVVTTGADVSANFSFKGGHPDHALRYERAREFVTLVKQLWDSYEDDALVLDKAGGVFLDPAKVHLTNHEGKYYSVTGPLNVARPPQGYPVIVQAGASEDGRDLAAQTAEVIFTANLNLPDAQAFYADVKGRLGHYGRRPQDLVIMPGLFPVLGGTEAEARQNLLDLHNLAHPTIVWEVIRQVYQGRDFTGWSLDDKAPPAPADTNLNKSRLKLISDYIERDQPSLRQLYTTLAGARGHHVVAGTPEQVADIAQQWFEQGAADGFNIMPPVLPTGLDDFIEQVLPILRRRGLFREDYEGTTLRDHLGLARPANSFQARQSVAEPA
jgi:N-acetyl-S-(2-succino)cysteine monooxygenase